MELLPLTNVQHQLKSGSPLPWNVRDEGGNLLLAKGQPTDESLVARLLERGMFVDAEEAARARSDLTSSAASTERVMEHFASLQARLQSLLMYPNQPNFLVRVKDTYEHLDRMSARSPDPLIFNIMRPSGQQAAGYGVTHSLHAAAVCCLLSRKLGHTGAERSSLVQAALTMNLAMAELQSQLAQYRGTLNPGQRKVIDEHPLASANLLRSKGCQDELWLKIVEEHHEAPAGAGYPRKIQEPHPLAQLLRLVDIFLAKHAPRAGRTPLPAKQAAQEIYKQTNGHPVAALLIKEFGIYPPGCLVTLASGEMGVVVRRGETAAEPKVAVLVNKKGDPLSTPVRRDTARPEYKIQGTAADALIRVGINAELLYERSEL